jgi:hypothetical protein
LPVPAVIEAFTAARAAGEVVLRSDWLHADPE